MQNQLPKEIQDLISSPLIYEKIEKIGEKYGLNLDQMGELDAETRAVLAGYAKSENYAKDIADRLEISRDTAEKIAAEAGTEIFTNLRTAMREAQEKKEATEETRIELKKNTEQNKTLAEFEREGNLNLEKEPETLENPINITHGEGNPDLIINQIENPETAGAGPVNILDHMLAGPTSQPTKVEVVTAPTNLPGATPTTSPRSTTSPSSPATPVPKTRPYSSDPYREPLI